jgi:uncharacterized membrane protein YeaQ/YmgE (transglycosylase-associated protein family)
MKALIYIGLTIGSLLGGWLGSMIDHDPLFGPWSLLFSTVGALIGIWAGYKISKYYG